MRFIVLVVMILVSSACTNKDLGTLYSPDELKSHQYRQLEGLSFEQLKSTPLERLSILYTGHLPVRLTIDGNSIEFCCGFSVYRKIVLMPGKHRLEGVVKVVMADWEPYIKLLKENGYAKGKKGGWYKTFYYKNGYKTFCEDNKDYSWLPFSIDFETEEKGVYYIPTMLLKNAKYKFEDKGCGGVYLINKNGLPDR